MNRLYLYFSLFLIIIFPDPLLAGDSFYPDQSKTLKFKIYADNDPVGTDKIVFKRTGETLTVNRTVNMSFDWWFINVANYSHKTKEIWKNGKLLTVNSRTNFSGKKFKVTGFRENNKFLVKERSLVKRDSPVIGRRGRITPTSWWTPRVTRSDYLLDTQHGRFIQVQAHRKSNVKLELNEKRIKTTRYNLSGELELSLWYNANDELCQIKYNRKGMTFVHRRIDDSTTLSNEV